MPVSPLKPHYKCVLPDPDAEKYGYEPIYTRVRRTVTKLERQGWQAYRLEGEEWVPVQLWTGRHNK